MDKSVALYKNLEKLGIADREYLPEEEAERIYSQDERSIPKDVLCDTQRHRARRGRNRQLYYRYPEIPSDEIQNRIAAFDALAIRKMDQNVKTIKQCTVFIVGIICVLSVVLFIYLLASLIKI